MANGRLPNFLIVGAQKAGTTAAIRNLSLHPNIWVFSGTTDYGQKEVEYFNQHWHRGNEWYKSNFPDSECLIGEKTAELLHRTVCHRRMYKTNPDFKLVVLLRNPVDRAYSQWKMAALRKGDEDRTFRDVIETEAEILRSFQARKQFYRCAPNGVSCWREGYLLKGMYSDQLKSLYTFFSKHQVFIGISERIRKDTKKGYNEIFNFLGLPHLEADFKEYFVGEEYGKMSGELRQYLNEMYRRPNEELFHHLGFNVPEWLGEVF